jgi:hypothetical protein
MPDGIPARLDPPAGMVCAEPTLRYPQGRTGTNAGYQAHLKGGEEPCGPCKQAEAARAATRRRAPARDCSEYRQVLAEYSRRVAAGEPVPACAKPSLEYPAGRTGLRAGYSAHRYAGEEPCTACMEANTRAAAEDRAADSEAVFRGNLWSNYRLRPDGYQEKLSGQGGVCAICGTADPGGDRRFHVDHDHSCCPGSKSCGKCVRGLLCRNCNFALGFFGDDPDVLVAALSYLLSHGKETAS